MNAVRMMLLGAVAAITVGCTPATSSSPFTSPPPSPSGFVDLPTLPGVSIAPGGTPTACGGVGLEDAIVHGSANAADPVWLNTVAEPTKKVVVGWPAGFRARFAPSLELIDATGTVVARESDRLSTIGGYPGPDRRFFIWEFNGRSYPCQ